MSVRNHLLILIFNFAIIYCTNLSLVVNHSEDRQIQQVRHRYTNSRSSYRTDSFTKLKNLSKPRGLESNHSRIRESIPDIQCNFETDCSWKWKTNQSNGFSISNGESNIKGLETDADNKSTGHFLLLRLKPNTTTSHVTSASISPSSATCRLQLWIFQKDMVDGMIQIITTTVNHTEETIIDYIPGENNKEWIRYDRRIGKKKKDFMIILEVVPSGGSQESAVVAFDNLKLLDCFPESKIFNSCSASQNCDKIPYGAHCNFEQDSCGWYNTNGGLLLWSRHVTGKYMYVKTAANPNSIPFGSSTTLNSIIFNPPPRVHGNVSSGYYNSCTIRFYLYQSGISKNGIMLQVTEMKPEKNVTYDLLWSYNNFGDKWVQKIVVLPNITHKYYFHFDARKGIRYIGDVAIDDFSMSPECFGLNIPPSELNNYNYWDPNVEDTSSILPHKDFAEEPYYTFTSCGVTGRYGPWQDNCTKFYKNTLVNVRMKTRGIQTWMAPAEGYYTFIVLGASGGKGSAGMGSSRSAMVRIVIELQKWQEILILVGQEGSNACANNFSQIDCGSEAGGGGGGSFVVIYNRTRDLTPLAIAAGGGGLGSDPFVDTGNQHGRATLANLQLKGLSFFEGPEGGKACHAHGDGGFGGGGGGCVAGGGGGGYMGGNTLSTNSTHGEGGYSFFNSNRTISTFSTAWPGNHTGAGSVIAIPAVRGCGCKYRCLALNVRRSQVACICPKDKTLDVDGKSCIPDDPADTSYPDWVVVLFCFMFPAVVIAFGFVCFMLYTRYQHRVVRIAEYNFNYEFGGSVYSVKNLTEIPRNQVILEKVIGRGQFGEVYRGSYIQQSESDIKKPVAIKTLLSLSNEDSEVDFLMEALIMSQFSHPNIVHFIGVCIDKNPRYIVLELLPGGDLKKFLRESRPKPNKTSSLTMRDLVTIAIDVAKGCLYMESKHFIHRDIAARNCLLTTDGPGRVIKIADFGMSRDIYISDYYRKGGTGMLPVKWMPPEAFLDGIFTSATDVWSFGILLWEIMSMGYVPYTGHTNDQVMKLVAGGGRLEPPPNCPNSIYAIMKQCWQTMPTQRPKFGSILERLGYCLQDLKVTCSPLPIFTELPLQGRENIDVSRLDRMALADTPNYTTIMADRSEIGFTSAVTKLSQSNSGELQENVTRDKLFLSPKLKAGQILPIWLPNHILTNHSLKGGISLDAGAFANQSYTNLTLEDKVTRNRVIQTGSYSLPKENRF